MINLIYERGYYVRFSFAYFYESELKSYTKTAEYLHMTQPTVTQHVQYLERQYGVPLVEYHGKSVMLTPKGEQLYHFIMTMEADSERVRQILKEPTVEKHLQLVNILCLRLWPNILRSIRMCKLPCRWKIQNDCCNV